MEDYNQFAILLVEDDDAARNILASVLAIKFPQVPIYTAENGIAGLECFKKHYPAVVITDINMPEMDGIRMAGAIRSISAGVKLIILTAFSDKSILHSSAATVLESDYYIMKPVDYDKLFSAIQQCLAGIEPDNPPRLPVAAI